MAASPGFRGSSGSCCRPAPRWAGAPWFLAFLIGGTFVTAYFLPTLTAHPASLVDAPKWFTAGTPIWIVVSGLLTGFGTQIGNGCTSGHGVCGLARLSTRSFVAVSGFF